jgi:hypothetical protein
MSRSPGKLDSVIILEKGGFGTPLCGRKSKFIATALSTHCILTDSQLPTNPVTNLFISLGQNNFASGTEDANI